MRKRLERPGAAVALLAILAAACNAPPEPTGPHAAIAKVHRAHCGACHTRVDPGKRTRAQLQAALAHHHSRVHLTDAEWSEMIDYLAADGPKGDPSTALGPR